MGGRGRRVQSGIKLWGWLWVWVYWDGHGIVKRITQDRPPTLNRNEQDFWIRRTWHYDLGNDEKDVAEDSQMFLASGEYLSVNSTGGTSVVHWPAVPNAGLRSRCPYILSFHDPSTSSRPQTNGSSTDPPYSTPRLQQEDHHYLRRTRPTYPDPRPDRDPGRV